MTTNRMKDEQFQAIKDRAGKASEAPWDSDAWHVVDGRGESVCETEISADAEFIAHARTDVPALVEEVEALQQENRMREGAYKIVYEEVERLRGLLKQVATYSNCMIEDAEHKDEVPLEMYLRISALANEIRNEFGETAE